MRTPPRLVMFSGTSAGVGKTTLARGLVSSIERGGARAEYLPDDAEPTEVAAAWGQRLRSIFEAARCPLVVVPAHGEPADVLELAVAALARSPD